MRNNGEEKGGEGDLEKRSTLKGRERGSSNFKKACKSRSLAVCCTNATRGASMSHTRR